ncbi:hypothetical protein EB796_024727 [Bugula neritina]|uniref:Uncharacterized protein n=1 Tax=Bugula neritina TaxID=10212 RepID=A0A7J7IT20_BUGNE|nr:hypothetical protein EB796_024727 [Bugula neritina]
MSFQQIEIILLSNNISITIRFTYISNSITFNITITISITITMVVIVTMGCSCLPVRTTSPKFLVYLQCYFLSIAYILGTGVLSLPVSLARSGMVPFFVVMTVVLIFQISNIDCVFI